MSDNVDSPAFFRRPSRYDPNSKIMLTAIVSLSLVIALVTAFHIYARCALRRQARRRAVHQSLGITTTAHRVHGGHDQNPKRGLDPSIIASLPIFVLKSCDINGSCSTTNNVECAVCLSILADGEMVRKLPNCKHNFHSECIDKWLNSHSNCPICRTEVEPKVMLPEPREGSVGNFDHNPLPTAPLMECSNSGLIANVEGSDGGVRSSGKMNGSSSRLSSFRKILTRERSSRQMQTCGQDQEDHAFEDLERQ